MRIGELLILLLGGLFGAIIGFLISELRILLNRFFKNKRLKKRFIPYLGCYNAKTKGGQPSLLKEVKITYKKKNILGIELDTITNGKAEGEIIMDKSSLTHGIAYYRHTDPGFESLSGFYNIVLFDPGIVHAKVSYLLGRTREEISELYIWTKK